MIDRREFLLDQFTLPSFLPSFRLFPYLMRMSGGLPLEVGGAAGEARDVGDEDGAVEQLRVQVGAQVGPDDERERHEVRQQAPLGVL